MNHLRKTSLHILPVTLRHLSEEEVKLKQSSISANGSGIQDSLFRSNLTPDDEGLIAKAAELNGKANQIEIVKAKYVLGADGAYSWGRNQLGFTLLGDSTDYICVALNMILVTHCPDIRIAMRNTQRGRRERDSHPSREQAGPAVHPADDDREGGKWHGGPIKDQSTDNSRKRPAHHVAIQDQIPVL